MASTALELRVHPSLPEGVPAADSGLKPVMEDTTICVSRHLGAEQGSKAEGFDVADASGGEEGEAIRP